MSRWTAQATRIAVRIANRAHCSATVRSASGGALREVFPEAREQRCWVHYADLEIMPTSGQFQFRISQSGWHNQRGSGQTDLFEIATIWRAWPSCARLERRRYRPLGRVPRPTETVKIMPTF